MIFSYFAEFAQCHVTETIGSALEEPTIQVMKLLCYEFQDMPPLILDLFKANIDFMVDKLCDRMDEVRRDVWRVTTCRAGGVVVVVACSM